MAEAIFYLVRSGCAWRMLPRHFPPWPTVHAQLTRWRKDGTLRCMHDRLRAHAREKDGRDREPSAAVLDSQTARATGTGGPDRGFDAAKKTFGRKRHILVDVSGLILLAHIHAASLHDTVGARQMVELAPMAALPRLELVWADSAYTGPFATWLEKERGWRMEVPFHRQRQAWRLRTGGAAGRLPRPPAPLGGREDLRLAVPITPPRPRRPRAATRNRGGDDPCRHEPEHAEARHVSGQRLCR
jgi:putative transposase